MKRNLICGLILAVGVIAFTANADAQGHRGGRSDRHSSSHTISGSRPGRGGDNKQPAFRGSNSNKDNKHGNMRPGGNRPGNGGSAVRPGHNGNNHRPGNNGGSHNWNGGNHNGNHEGVRPGNGNMRPGNGVNHGVRPGANHGHRPSARPGIGVVPPVHRPGYGPAHRPPHMRPPMRPGRPVHRPWVRPLPPRHWRPVHRTPLLSGFLGLTFGITLDLSLNSLRNGGYVVDGYDSDQVFLRNVREQGFYWPDATLYYSNGGLLRSQFYYSTLGDYRSAFNQVYARLVGNYGSPVETVSNGVSVSARWFGYDGDYITLEYTPMNAGDGLRYFTILTYGN